MMIDAFGDEYRTYAEYWPAASKVASILTKCDEGLRDILSQ